MTSTVESSRGWEMSMPEICAPIRPDTGSTVAPEPETEMPGKSAVRSRLLPPLGHCFELSAFDLSALTYLLRYATESIRFMDPMGKGVRRQVSFRRATTKGA